MFGGIAGYAESGSVINCTAVGTVQAVFLPRPVQIDSIEKLQQIAHDRLYPLDWDYALAADLDAAVTAGWNDGAGFDPIGELYRPDEQGVGMFGAIGEQGAVKT